MIRYRFIITIVLGLMLSVSGCGQGAKQVASEESITEYKTESVVEEAEGSDGVKEDNTVTVKIRDKGVGIEDINKAMEPLFTTAPEEERAGLGFAVMQSFCDRVRVKSEPQKGTTVTLIKRIGADG